MHAITLLGATGFTGTLTAQYLAEHLDSQASWAIAGRNREALDKVRASLTGNIPDIIVLDLADDAAMLAMARNTKVLATTVGPYLKYGDAAVRAATEAGIAYVDLTGEPQFVDQVWLDYHEKAQATGAKLVHACGFDSIPYDLGVYLAVKSLPAGQPINAPKAVVDAMNRDYRALVQRMDEGKGSNSQKSKEDFRKQILSRMEDDNYSSVDEDDDEDMSFLDKL